MAIKSHFAPLDALRKARLRLGGGTIRRADGSLIGLEDHRHRLRDLLRGVLTRAENQSALLVGPRGSGKSLVLQQVLTDLASELRAKAAASDSASAASASASSSLSSLGHGLPFITVHINGYAITDDASAAREMSAQLAINPEAAAAAAAAERDAEALAASTSASREPEPTRRKRGRAPVTPAGTKVERRTVAHACVRAHRQTFEQHLEYVVATLRDGCATGRPVVLVIDEFDVFCARTKQTLLYNLLDLTQDPTVRFALVGITTRLDVVDLLEKRLRSRFSHRQFLVGPLSQDHYQQVAMAALLLPEKTETASAMTATDAAASTPPRSIRGKRRSQATGESPSRTEKSNPDSTHNETIRALLADTTVLGVLRRWHQLGRPVRQLREWLIAALSLCIARAQRVATASTSSPTSSSSSSATLPSSLAPHCLLTKADMLQAAEALTVRPILRMLPDLSPLELSLLGALAHIEDREDAGPSGAVIANFEMVLREYNKFTRAQGAGTMAVHREVALKAFERLMSMGFVVFTAVAQDASMAIRSAAHMSRHCQLVRLSIDPAHVITAVRKGEVRVPTALKHWILHGEQT